jgi:hypothetical protein
VGHPWRQQHRYKDYDGYAIWLWIGADLKLRRDYFNRLDLHDAFSVQAADSDDDDLSTVLGTTKVDLQAAFRKIHALDKAGFVGAVMTSLDPPPNPSQIETKKW